MLEEQTGMFTGEKGFSIFFRHWEPEGESSAIAVLVHGYASHSGRFSSFAVKLNAAGYDVFAMDIRGHGRSDGTPGDIENFDLCADDLRKLIVMVRELNPGKKIYLLGHSMGGSVSCLFALKYHALIDGLVLISSLVHMSQDIPEILKKIARILSALLPKMPVEDFNIEGLSRLQENIEEYRNDPLTYTGKVRARMGAHMLSLEQLVPEWISGVKLPVFISHGGGDPIIDPAGSRQLYEAAASEDKLFRIFPELYHEVFYEPEAADVMGAIIEWLAQRVN